MSDAGALARTWIECWSRGVPEQIPLAEDFAHTSPFGRVEGRETYLAWVKPLAARNVTGLRIRRILSGPDEAVVHFEMETPGGLVQVCDWIVAEGETIKAIHSFYDATGLQAAPDR